MAFETIVASGPNSSSPHASVSDRRVQEGDFITIDMGAKYNGYCSDMTRTVAVGHASEHMQRIYQTVLQAQLGALNVLSANKTGHEVDAVARNIIDQAGYKGAFGHSLGHSVGLDIHEEPRLSPGYEKTLPAGVVITVEPGIYLAGDCGVRIEDMALLQENGCRNLTHVAKELLVLK